MLKNAYILKDTNSKHWEIGRNVTVSHDMNKEERNKDTELREETRLRNASQRERNLPCGEG